jgi:hypothetical protein
MYIEVPTKVSAMELMSSPDTPKSHILISPWELHRMLDGLISVNWIDEESRVNGMIHHSYVPR